MSPEDMQRFEIEAADYDYGLRVAIRCTRLGCPWDAELDESTLAELVQRAGEHTEVCP